MFDMDSGRLSFGEYMDTQLSTLRLEVEAVVLYLPHSA